ncbi:hypothetical protein CCOA0160 [Campylobacter coli RM2228]|nr:hypothetical protein CCOA0160 [Campylobacter coli RM2228]
MKILYFGADKTIVRKYFYLSFLEQTIFFFIIPHCP